MASVLNKWEDTDRRGETQKRPRGDRDRDWKKHPRAQECQSPPEAGSDNLQNLHESLWGEWPACLWLLACWRERNSIVLSHPVCATCCGSPEKRTHCPRHTLQRDTHLCMGGGRCWVGYSSAWQQKSWNHLNFHQEENWKTYGSIFTWCSPAIEIKKLELFASACINFKSVFRE